jgi:hypothetical protein
MSYFVYVSLSVLSFCLVCLFLYLFFLSVSVFLSICLTLYMLVCLFYLSVFVFLSICLCLLSLVTLFLCLTAHSAQVLALMKNYQAAMSDLDMSIQLAQSTNDTRVLSQVPSFVSLFEFRSLSLSLFLSLSLLHCFSLSPTLFLSLSPHSLARVFD